MNDNEVKHKYTLLQNYDQIVSVNVCRAVTIRKEFTKPMPSGDLTVIGGHTDDEL